MTTRWVSGTKTWCEDCQKFFYDNAVGRKKHLASLWHQQCRQKRISEMTKQDKETKVLADQVSREMQFLEAKAQAQSNADYRAHRKASSVADQYSTYRPIDSSEYTMTAGSSGQHGGGGMLDGTNYYDADFLELQRQKLYGISAEEAEKFRQEEVEKLLGKKSEDEEDKEGEGSADGESEGDAEDGEAEDGEEDKEGEEVQPAPPPGTPPPPPEDYDPTEETAETLEDKRKERERLNEQRQTEGIAGRYEVVSMSAMHGSYRPPDPTPEPAEEDQDGEEAPQSAPSKGSVNFNIPTSAASLKRKRGELEEEDLWAANLLEGKPADYHGAAVAPKKEKPIETEVPARDAFREREPEKPLFQAIEDELEDGPVEFKKRRTGNQNSRKKK